MICYHNIFSFVKSTLTQFFHFNELEIWRQPGYFF